MIEEDDALGLNRMESRATVVLLGVVGVLRLSQAGNFWA